MRISGCFLFVSIVLAVGVNQNEARTPTNKSTKGHKSFAKDLPLSRFWSRMSGNGARMKLLIANPRRHGA